MGGDRSKQFVGRNTDSGYLQGLRERVLDHPDEEDEVSGISNDSYAETGPVKVIVKQDGIGRTGGIVLGIFAGLGFGIAVVTLILKLSGDAATQEQLRKTETEARMVEYYLQDPSYRPKEEIEAWSRFKRENPKEKFQ